MLTKKVDGFLRYVGSPKCITFKRLEEHDVGEKRFVEDIVRLVFIEVLPHPFLRYVYVVLWRNRKYCGQIYADRFGEPRILQPNNPLA